MSPNTTTTEIKDLVGSTDQYSGTVGTTPANIPSSAGDKIAECLVRCSSDNTPITKRLLISFDSGTTFLTLSPGEFVGWSLKGSPTQIVIKGNVASVSYEIVLNREP